ncbi:putative Multisubstrate pseudouridine synthase 7 [Amylocarpus encephaloides]|uniref:Multisubstrate pseudouridine synthase 7 n=1 Tax=Amylocarpus encephaloides TaxID=45428 RepID=A0A9P8C8D1_9HELO|nr:putative Multisubstrate pseudouridine synthase 7 [Amylocarpus encephaloides]
MAAPSNRTPLEEVNQSNNNVDTGNQVVDELRSANEVLRELELGILYYVNPLNTGFCGIFKHRFSDFLVHEIAPDGSIVRLTDDGAPAFNPLSPEKSSSSGFVSQDVRNYMADSFKDKPIPDASLETGHSSSSDAPATAKSNGGSEPESSPSQDNQAPPPVEADPDVPLNRNIISSYFGSDVTERVFALYRAIVAKPNARASEFKSFDSDSITDRERRTIIHQDVRKIFHGLLETRAMSLGKIRISAAGRANPRSKAANPSPRNQNSRNQNNKQMRGKVSWNELGGEYLHFTLYKENKDTMEVLNIVARLLKVGIKDFAFAGTKDRRAATTQRVSVLRQHGDNLAWQNRNLWWGRMGNFKHEKYELKLGELQGNHFTITLRDCHFEFEEGLDINEKAILAQNIVHMSTQALLANGFLNYFGLQRFGTFGVGTDAIGMLILQNKFKEATDAILSFSEESLAHSKQKTGPGQKINQDDIARTAAIHLFKSGGNSKEALSKMPRRFTAESCVIRHLSSQKLDYIGALLSIPRNLRTMYVHAYQSRVWNFIVSERWSRYGCKVIEGDLILVDSRAALAAANRDEVDDSGEVVVHAHAGDAAYSKDDTFQRARALSVKEAASGLYTIFDIVLPLPGFDMEYPLNDIGDFYKEYMGSDEGGGLDPANMRRPNRDFSLSGSYRKFISKVGDDLSFEVRAYHNDIEQMVETDVEMLDKSKPARSSHSGKSQKLNRQDPTEDKPLIKWEDNTGKENMLPSKHQDESKRMRGLYVGTAAHNAWVSAPETIQAQDKALAEVAALKRADPSQLPTMKDTFVETSVVDESRRTGTKAVVIHESAVVGADKSMENGVVVVVSDIEHPDTPVIMSPHLPAAPPSTPATACIGIDLATSKPEFSSLDSITEQDVLKRIPSSFSIVSSSSHEESAAEEMSSVESESDVSTTAKVQQAPTMVGVILKFSLGSSQYATMVLRELMKAGGLKNYQTEFTTVPK